MEKKYESPNAKVFAAVKKVERAKVVRRRFVKALIPAVAGLGVVLALAMPYVSSYNTINEFVEVNHDDITYVEDASEDALDVSDKQVVDNIPWGTPPEGLSFEGDVVGYLSDEGDVLNNVYPITQSSLEDPNYYINHDVYGNESELGNLYKDSRNRRGLADDVSAIYGHNLFDGGMFGILTNYADKESYLGTRTGQELYDQQREQYGENGNSFTYVDEYGTYRLDVVCAGVYDGLDVLNLVGNFENGNDRAKAVQLFTDGSDIKADVTFDEDSKIVIFQTCEDEDSNTYGDENKRVYVICKAKQLVKYRDFSTAKENSGKSLS